MRTSLDIPPALIEEARRLLGFKSRTDAVVHALREVIRRERAEGLQELQKPNGTRPSRASFGRNGSTRA